MLCFGFRRCWRHSACGIDGTHEQNSAACGPARFVRFIRIIRNELGYASSRTKYRTGYRRYEIRRVAVAKTLWDAPVLQQTEQMSPNLIGISFGCSVGYVVAAYYLPGRFRAAILIGYESNTGNEPFNCSRSSGRMENIRFGAPVVSLLFPLFALPQDAVIPGGVFIAFRNGESLAVRNIVCLY